MAKTFRADLAVAVLIISTLTLAVISMVAMGTVFPDMDVWRSDASTKHATFFALVTLIFVPAMSVARFSFGYLVAVPLLLAVAGFLWITFFSPFVYPKDTARWSMLAALVCALAPLLFVSWPLPRPALSLFAVNRLAGALLLASGIVLLCDASFGVAIGSPDSTARNLIARPSLLNYATGIFTIAILPYLFAFYATRGGRILAVVILLLELAYYPVVVNKTVLLLPVALPGLFWLFRRCEPRTATIIIYLALLAVGLADFAISTLAWHRFSYYLLRFSNLRLIGMPSLALDHYADFFASRPLTGFCQISIIKRVFGCAYDELGPSLAAVYHNGNLNASFLATEGIASVGLKLSPLSALICAFVLSIGNAASRHLSPQFVAVSACAAVPAIMNVPLTTALLTNGIAALFLLWWLTPSLSHVHLVTESTDLSGDKRKME